MSRSRNEFKYQTTKPIDGNKLEALLNPLLKKERITKSDLSRECGYADSFFSNSIGKGQLNKPAIVFLELKYGIKYEQYAPTVDEPKAEPMPQIVDNSELLDKLDEVNANIKELANIQLRLLALMEKRTLRPIAREVE